MGWAEKHCPRCKDRMWKGGAVRAGPRGGKRPVYHCRNCGYQTIGA